MITANTVRQSTEGGWWDPPLYLPSYLNYREFLKLQRESCRAGGASPVAIEQLGLPSAVRRTILRSRTQ